MTLLLILVLALAVLGVPLFAALGLAALGTYWQSGLDPSLAIMGVIRSIEAPALAALPLFAFSAILLARSKVPARLTELGRSALGQRPASLAVFALMLCALMTALSGAAGITALVLGGLLLPALVQAGYSERVSFGMLGAGSGIGVLIAPSVPLILYAVIGQQVAPQAGIHPHDLFLAAALPGLLILALMASYMMVQARDNQPLDPAPLKPFINSLRENLWELPLPLVVLGGIYSGGLQLVEAAAISAAWLLFSLVMIRREIPFSRLPALISESMVLVAAVLLVLSLSMVSAAVLTDAGLVERLIEWIEPYIGSSLGLLLLINLVLLVAGLLLDGVALLLVLAPLIVPVALAFGVDPLHLGIVYLVNLQLGCHASPSGSNSLLAGQHPGYNISDTRRAALPFLGLLLIGLLVIIWWPGLSLSLPALFGR